MICVTPDLQEIAIMTTFLSLHAAAKARGDGLRPELLALVAGIAPHCDSTPRPDGMVQSGPDPKIRAADEPTGVSMLPQQCTPLPERDR
jgi:hypothetical protein